MTRAIATALALVMLVGCATSGGTPHAPDYSRLILGRWLPRHGTKFIIFYPDGSWAVQRHEAAEPYVGDRRWHIRRGTLTMTFEGRPETETILEISRTSMVTYVVPGDRLIYDRVP